MKRTEQAPLTPTEMLILGFGHARSFVGCGAFSLRQLAIVSAEEEYPVDISNLYTPAGGLANRGYLQKEMAATHDHDHDFPFGGRGYRFQEPGLKPLLDTTLHGVRHLGKTLPEMLRLFVSVEAIAEQAGFFDLLEAQLLELPSA